jgi:hypothetical protein
VRVEHAHLARADALDFIRAIAELKDVPARLSIAKSSLSVPTNVSDGSRMTRLV